jgi:hypothetical protein
MEHKTQECDQKNVTVLRLRLKHHRLVGKGLANVFMELEEVAKFAHTLYSDNDLDNRFQEVFIELITKRLQKHIGEAIGKVNKQGNSTKAFIDENKMRNRALNAMKLANG